MTLHLTFEALTVAVPSDRPFSIGRLGDLALTDNPFLHRRFLTITQQGGIWVLANVGDQLAATVSDDDGRFEALLGPGAVLPIAFARTVVRFAAGSDRHELLLECDVVSFKPPPRAVLADGSEPTMGPGPLTPDQRLMIIALAESALRSNGAESSRLPTSRQAANRLGWTEKKFSRKLDNVCEKLVDIGVDGLKGGLGDSAAYRRARLVEYALAVRLVTRDDLVYLESGSIDAEG